MKNTYIHMFAYNKTDASGIKKFVIGTYKITIGRQT